MNKKKITDKIYYYGQIATIWFFILILVVSYLNVKADNIAKESNKPINEKNLIVDVIGSDTMKVLANSINHVITKGNSLKNDLNKKVWKKPTSFKRIKVSHRGKNMIKQFETLQLTSYRIKGETSNTIGWGHKINSDDPIWLRRKWVGEKITKQQAEEIFRKDIEEFVEPALNRIAAELLENDINPNNVRQSAWDGLASMIFNCGERGVKTTEFYEYFKVGKFDKAISMVEETRVYMNGHKTRRQAEQELMSAV